MFFLDIHDFMSAMDTNKYEIVEGHMGANQVSFLLDKETGKTWVFDGNNRHDGFWRPVEGGPNDDDNK